MPEEADGHEEVIPGKVVISTTQLIPAKLYSLVKLYQQLSLTL